MEVVPGKLYGGIRSYWKRRGYRRLERWSSPFESPGRKGKLPVAKLGSPPGRGRVSRWLVRLRKMRIRMFRIRIPSPLKILHRIRDAYVDCMLGMAGKTAGLSTQNGPEVWSKRIPRRRPSKTKTSEFEQRLLFEIYKSLVMSGQIQL